MGGSPVPHASIDPCMLWLCYPGIRETAQTIVPTISVSLGIHRQDLSNGDVGDCKIVAVKIRWRDALSSGILWSNLVVTDQLKKGLVKRGVKGETRRTFRADNETPPLLGAPIDSLEDIDQFLLVLQHPVKLVVVSGAKITHHVLVAEEEHDRHRVVELVHLFEVRNFVEVAEVDHGE